MIFSPDKKEVPVATAIWGMYGMLLPFILFEWSFFQILIKLLSATLYTTKFFTLLFFTIFSFRMAGLFLFGFMYFLVLVVKKRSKEPNKTLEIQV